MIRGLASILALALLWAAPALALSVTGVATLDGIAVGPDAPSSSAGLQVAQDTESGDGAAAAVPPMPGELIIPQNSLKTEPENEGERKCMTVCARWGEECMLINKGAGGMERRCRRTCKQLGEECL